MLDHVTWWRDQTGYKHPVLSHNFQSLAPLHLPYYPRRNSLTLKLLTFPPFLPNRFFSSLEPAKKFQYNSKLCLSQIPIASHRKYSQTISNSVWANFQSHLIKNVPKKISNCVLAKFQSHIIEITLRHFQMTSMPISNFISSKIF